ncbi:hypothetical protein AVEN_110158-1, partial [Araneus ventricosus]
LSFRNGKKVNKIEELEKNFRSSTSAHVSWVQPVFLTFQTRITDDDGRIVRLSSQYIRESNCCCLNYFPFTRVVLVCNL